MPEFNAMSAIPLLFAHASMFARVSALRVERFSLAQTKLAYIQMLGVTTAAPTTAQTI
jgi:hypothetical protein